MSRGRITMLILLSWVMPHIALAQISITDIVYDPPGTDAKREWVGIVNMGSEPVILTDLRLRTSAGTNHKITSLTDGDTLAAGARAAIVQDEAAFWADNPSFPGTVFRASFSLTNKSGVVHLVDKSGATIATKTYEAPPAAPKAAPAKKTQSKKTTTKEPARPLAAAPATTLNEPQSDDDRAPIGVSSAALIAAASAGMPADAAAPSAVTWALSALALAGFSGIAVFGSRRAKSKEWDIEEITEE